MKTENHKFHIPVLSENELLMFAENFCIQKNMESFGEALQRYMDELRIDREILAKLTGIAETSIYYYLHGKREISADHLTAVCIALKLHPIKSQYLFSLTHNRLCSNRKRDMLCLTYIFACTFNEKFNLISCNKLLKSNRMKPLTSLGEKTKKGV